MARRKKSSPLEDFLELVAMMPWWAGVMLADTSQPGRPIVTLAPEGRLDLDRERQEVAIVLMGESIRYVPGDQPGVYDVARARDLRFAIPADTVFPDASTLARGTREMRLGELAAAAEAKRAKGESPHNEIMGWTLAERQNVAHWATVFLESGDESVRLQTRARVTRELIRDKSETFTVTAHGDDLLSQMLSLTFCGDFVSLYLAALNNVDPENIDAINTLMAARPLPVSWNEKTMLDGGPGSTL